MKQKSDGSESFRFIMRTLLKCLDSTAEVHHSALTRRHWELQCSADFGEVHNNSKSQLQRYKPCLRTVGLVRTWDWDRRGLLKLSNAVLGELGGVPEDENDPLPSVNHEKETKDPEDREGLSDGSLRRRRFK